MKNYFCGCLYLMIIVALTYGCEQPVETEVENRAGSSFDRAIPLDFGQPFLDQIEERGNNDHFSVYLDKDRLLVARVDPVPAEIDIVVELFDLNQERIAYQIGGVGQPVTLESLTPSGTYYLRVSDRSNNAESEDPYTLLVVADSSDIHELNNTFAEATPQLWHEPFSGAVRPRGDLDNYVLTAPRAGVIDVAINPVPSNINVIVELFDNNQNRLTWASANPGQGVFFDYLVPQGNYFLRISDRSNDAASEILYQTIAEFDSTDQYEMNNSFGEASMVEIGDSLIATSRSIGDIDYYRFQTDIPGVIDCHIAEVPDEIDLVGEIYDDQQQLVKQVIGGLSQPIQIEYLAPAGIYYLRIFDRSFNASSSQPYRACLQLDTTDPYEVNNSFNQATSIVTNTAYQAKIRTIGDEDFYRLDQALNGTINISVTPVPSNIDLAVLLYDANQIEIGRFLGGAGQPANFDVNVDGVAGPVYIRIFDRSHNATSSEFYTLLVQ